MTDKIRIVITTTIEYEPSPEHYREGTIEQMAMEDFLAASDDPDLFMSMEDADTRVLAVVVKETGEIVPVASEYDL